MEELASAPLRPSGPRSALGLLVGVASVAASTALIYPLREAVPVVSTGVVYLLAVLLVSTWWGLRLGLLTALASAAAFNFFHIPPTGRFEIAESEDWLALGVFLAAAVVAGTVAEAARARAAEADLRRREADLAAEMARLLLSGTELEEMLDRAAAELARTAGAGWARIETQEHEAAAGELAFPLGGGERRLGTLVLPADVPENVRARLRDRVLPSLEALLAAALDREALQAQVVETRALRRSDEIKTAVLRAVSHDLRSPLTAIVAASEALESPAIGDDDRRELAATVVTEATRLSGLIDKLLDLSRLQAGVAEPRRDWCAIDEIVRAALDDLAVPADRVSVSVAPSLPLVRADGGQLERAIANLLENALRYSGPGPVGIRAGVVRGRLFIRVVDSGPGIPPAETERIFEPFYRSTDAGPRHTGSGLGLAVAKGFVEANGGRLWVESTLGQGSTFVIAFDLAAPGDDGRDGTRPAAAEEVRAP